MSKICLYTFNWCSARIVIDSKKKGNNDKLLLFSYQCVWNAANVFIPMSFLNVYTLIYVIKACPEGPKQIIDRELFWVKNCERKQQQQKTSSWTKCATYIYIQVKELDLLRISNNIIQSKWSVGKTRRTRQMLLWSCPRLQSWTHLFWGVSLTDHNGI